MQSECALKVGTTLQGGKYRIESVLGQGGFGITYLAEQTRMGRKVAIKEFFMRDYCSRDESTRMMNQTVSQENQMVTVFKRKFLKEAQTLRALNHPCIVRLQDTFEENGTAYYVMEYIEGQSLDSMIKSSGALSIEEVQSYFFRLTHAVGYIHSQQINHLDIKPANVMIRKINGWPVLIDFGVSKHYDYSGTQTSSTPVALSNGYAPIEQYMPGGLKNFSPQADIYSLGATLYTMVTGEVPPNAHEVMNMGLPLWNVPEVWRKLIGECMKPRAMDRPESVDRVQKLLSKVTMKEENVKVDMSSDQVFGLMVIARFYPLFLVSAGVICFFKPKLQDASNCVQILWLVAFFVYMAILFTWSVFDARSDRKKMLMDETEEWSAKSKVFAGISLTIGLGTLVYAILDDIGIV